MNKSSQETGKHWLWIVNNSKETSGQRCLEAQGSQLVAPGSESGTRSRRLGRRSGPLWLPQSHLPGSRCRAGARAWSGWAQELVGHGRADLWVRLWTTWAALRGQFWIKPSRSLAQDCCVSKEAKGSGRWLGVARVRLWGFWLNSIGGEDPWWWDTDMENRGLGFMHSFSSSYS